MTVLSQTKIDSLDVTILRGGGAEVADWAAEQGFTLRPDTPEVLDFYSERSPYFMAAKFDATEAATDDFQGGDGIPVHLAIPLDRPWVPLRILATGKPADEIVQADVFLLTDEKPELLAGSGLTVERSERASSALLDDLRSDQNSSWVPEKAWLTYLKLDAPVRDLSYDLATSVSGDAPSVVDTGLVRFDEMDTLTPLSEDPTDDWSWSVTIAIVAALALVVGTGGLAFSRRA